MRKTRLAALLLAAPLAFAPAASADPILPGCYGVGGVIYCDPELRVLAGYGTTPTPVCVGTCTNVDVPNGDVGPVNVCLDYTDPSGTPHSQCYVNTPLVLRQILAVLCFQYNVCL
jgi:hypothetical protein